MLDNNNDNKRPLIVLTGPTAVGKTSLSLLLAKRIGGEIISADSMQVYRGMDIGTAKIRPDEMEGVAHHLIDCLDPREGFDVTRFVRMAKEAAEGIYQRGHIPIVTGGTGFYIQALLYDIDFSPHEETEEYRAFLRQLLETKGKEYLYEELRKVDPEYAASVHKNNSKRVIRALEYFHETGEKLSAHNRVQGQNQSPYSFAYFVLDTDREVLYKRIDQRVDQMMDQGLLKEVEGLYQSGLTRDHVSMKGIGYREFFDYFEGKCSLEEVTEQIKKDTRHFAKRQLTWFRREKEVIWVRKEDFCDEKALLSYLTGKCDFL